MRRYALPVVLAFLLVVAGATAGVGAGADPGAPPAPVESVDSESSTTLPRSLGTVDTVGQIDEFDVTPTTTFHVQLQSDRSAVWTVTVQYEFTDANETAAFETIAEDFEAGIAGPSADLYENLAAGAAEQTGREMTIGSIQRDATVDETPDVEDDSVVAVGTLELEFVWTDFLAQDGENLLLGDVFRTPNNGTWLRTLEAHQTLIIETPGQYQVSSTPGVSVSLQENAVVIEGPRTFAPDEHVQVVYSPTVTSNPPWLLLAGAVVLAGLIVVVGLFAYRRFGSPGGGASREGGEPTEGVTSGPGDTGGNAAGGSTAAGGGAAAGGGEAAGRGPATGTGEGATNTGGSPGTGTDTGANSGAGGESTGEGTPPAAGAEGGTDEGEEDLSLLSDTERVERLLERSGGRMRQADIVAETGWSDAKVSQLLSSMADEGRIEKLRLGRENLISLPDYGEDEESA